MPEVDYIFDFEHELLSTHGVNVMRDKIRPVAWKAGTDKPVRGVPQFNRPADTISKDDPISIAICQVGKNRRLP